MSNVLADGEVVPSAPKKQQWKTFSALTDRLLSKQRPTSREIKLLHYIFTADCDLSLLHKHRDVGVADLHIIDRPDGEQKQDEFAPIANSLIEQAKKENQTPIWYLERAISALKQLCEADTEIEFKPGIRGRLRYYGKRKIAGGQWETVHAAHTCVFESTAEGVMAALGCLYFPPQSYYGLSSGLPEVYKKLCDKYDALMSEADGLDQKLLAETFLQLVGTRVLHPFWDGNGRTFMAHLSLMLEREGIRIKDYELARSITKDLTNLNDDFLHRVLQDADLGLVQQHNHILMAINHRFRKDYMQRLRGSIEHAIEHGTDESGPYFPFYSEAAWIIKMTLLRTGLLELNEEERHAVEKRIEAIGDNLKNIPQPYQEYLVGKFKSYFLEDEGKAQFFHSSMYSLIRNESEDDIYEMLTDLMRSYEGTDTEFAMARQFEKSCRFGKEHITVVSKEFINPEVKKAILLWPEDTMGVFGLIRTMWDIANEWENVKVEPSSIIQPMAAVLKSQLVRTLYQDTTERNVKPWIIDAAVAVAGYTLNEATALNAVRCLRNMPAEDEGQGIVHISRTLKELANLSHDKETVDHALCIIQVLQKSADLSDVWGFCQNLEEQVYCCMQSDNPSEEAKQLKEELGEIRKEVEMSYNT